MKRVLAGVMTVLFMLGALTACAAPAQTSPQTTAQSPAQTAQPGAAAAPAQTTAPAPTQAPQKEWKIGMVAAGKFGDNGLNDALRKAMQTFTADTGIPVTSVEVNEFSDHEIQARNFGEQGYDLVIMGGTVSEVMPTILEDYPNTHYVLNKGTVDGYKNCTSVQFAEPQAGFIGGAFAVMMSEHLAGVKKVGWIGGMRIKDLELCRYSFEAGAKYAGGQATVAYVGDFTDVAKAKELASQMYDEGIVIVQAFAGGAANGVYQCAESQKDGVYAMGAATGQFDLSPKRILASHVIKSDEYFSEVCKEFVAGNLPSGIIMVGLADGATGIRISPYIGDLIPQDIKDKMADIQAKIISGEIVPPTTEEELAAYLKK